MAGTAYQAYGAPGRLSAAFAFAVVFPWGECPYLRREGRFRPAMADSMPCEPPSQACEVALCGPMMRGVALRVVYYPRPSCGRSTGSMACDKTASRLASLNQYAEL